MSSSKLQALKAQFADANPSEGGGGRYINVEGDHTVKIDEIKFIESKKDGKLKLVVSFEVTDSTADLAGTYSWVHDLSNHFYGAREAKRFLASAIGVPLDSKDAQDLGVDELEEAAAEDQPMSGSVCKLRTYGKKIKNSDKIFTVHEWNPS